MSNQGKKIGLVAASPKENMYMYILPYSVKYAKEKMMNFYELAELPYLDDNGRVQTVKNDANTFKALATEKKCAHCGKTFDVVIPVLYVYKTKFRGKQHWFCGWNCMCGFKRSKEGNDLRRKASKA